jgi:hypothetical protein
VSFILTAIGLLLLVGALAGIALGIFMALDPKTRGSGKLFAIWWVPALAAASGVLMRDVVTFAVGIFCFLVAGVVIVLEDRRLPKAQTVEKRDQARAQGGDIRLDSEKITRENRTKNTGRAAS